METQITESHDSQIIKGTEILTEVSNQLGFSIPICSSELLHKIYTTIDSPRNHHDLKQNKASIPINESPAINQTKCNCKKSKCLKLYC